MSIFLNRFLDDSRLRKMRFLQWDILMKKVNIEGLNILRKISPN